jgi:hypothetical protein
MYDRIVQRFSCWKLDLFCLNFGEIILLPKVNETERIQQHRHNCLFNVSFKIPSKTANIRLSSVDDHVVRPTHTAFKPGKLS